MKEAIAKGPRVLIAGEGSLANALHQVLSALGFGCAQVEGPVPCCGLPQPGDFGLVVASSREHLLDGLCLLSEIRVGCSIVVLPPLVERACREGLPVAVSRILAQGVTICSIDLPKVIEAISEQMQAAPMAVPEDGQLSRGVHASQLYDLVGNFGHGQERDLSNRYLAPGRLLIEADMLIVEDSEWYRQAKKAKSDFLREVIGPLQEDPHRYGNMGQEVIRLFGKAAPILDADIPDGADARAALVGDLGEFMLLLTECRELAGESNRTAEAAPTDLVEPIQSEGNKFRVLVVDDHAESWRPVLEVVADNLAKNELPTLIEFSTDGKNVAVQGAKDTEQRKFDQMLPGYDLVLLDVFLGDKNGLTVLEDIRKNFLWLPVVIWTTARQLEIPAAAALCNGFIFKKTTTCQELVDTITRWLEVGSAWRKYTLPQRFFDGAIRSLPKRKSAHEISTWCLRLLDGFHALDNVFLRFFNDHGGRHSQGLLQLVDKLINRSLGESSPLFSSIPTDREAEILALFLAVYCHELGMFPVDQSERARMRSATDRSSLEPVRKGHAVRGMVLLHDVTLSEADDFRPMMEGLKKCDADGLVKTLLCLITGYHSRMLDLTEDNFCRPCSRKRNNDNSPKRLSDVFPADYGLAINVSQAEDTLKKLGKHLEELEAHKPGVQERARRICAVFRFADALDIDRTRLPGYFLLFDEERIHTDERENLKRQVVKGIIINEKGVTLRIDAPPVNVACLREFEGFADEGAALDSMIQSPWSLKHRKLLHQQLDNLNDWLASYWAERCSLRLASSVQHPSWPPTMRTRLLDRLNHVNAWRAEYWSEKAGTHNEWLDSAPSERKIQEIASRRMSVLPKCVDSQSAEFRLVAGVTGLCVAAEVLDEYAAIEECGLQDLIKLNRVEWQKSGDWNPEWLTLLTAPQALTKPD